MIHMKCISKLYYTENPSSAEVKQLMLHQK